MSGGHFDYRQWQIKDIADAIDEHIYKNGKEDSDGYTYEYSDATIAEFKNAIESLKKAYIYAQRIDWLISGDDSEATFHERLDTDLSPENFNKILSSEIYGYERYDDEDAE